MALKEAKHIQVRRQSQPGIHDNAETSTVGETARLLTSSSDDARPGLIVPGYPDTRNTSSVLHGDDTLLDARDDHKAHDGSEEPAQGDEEDAGEDDFYAFLLNQGKQVVEEEDVQQRENGETQEESNLSRAQLMGGIDEDEWDAMLADLTEENENHINSRSGTDNQGHAQGRRNSWNSYAHTQYGHAHTRDTEQVEQRMCTFLAVISELVHVQAGCDVIVEYPDYLHAIAQFVCADPIVFADVCGDGEDAYCSDHDDGTTKDGHVHASTASDAVPKTHSVSDDGHAPRTGSVETQTHATTSTAKVKAVGDLFTADSRKKLNISDKNSDTNTDIFPPCHSEQSFEIGMTVVHGLIEHREECRSAFLEIDGALCGVVYAIRMCSGRVVGDAVEVGSFHGLYVCVCMYVLHELCVCVCV